MNDPMQNPMQNQMQNSKGQQHPLANYQFSSEELRVLRECNSESFFQRALPLGTAFGVGSYLAVKNGFLKPNIKYGAVPKVVVSCIVGYFMGKFSYQQKCAEKIMRLPDSKLAEVLRQRKRGGGLASFSPDGGLSLAPFTPNNMDVYSDEHARENTRSTSLNLDVESRPTISGLDDIYRPSVDNSTNFLEPELPLDHVKPGMTYEELRQRNREEYAKKQQSPYSNPLPPDGPLVIRERSIPADKSRNPQDYSPGKTTNKYGDAWE